MCQVSANARERRKTPWSSGGVQLPDAPRSGSSPLESTPNSVVFLRLGKAPDAFLSGGASTEAHQLSRSGGIGA